MHAARARARTARTNRTIRQPIVAAVVTVVLLLAAAALAAPAQASGVFSAHLSRAPYLTDLVMVHVNVNWATDQTATTGSLQWGPVSGGVCTLSNTMAATRNSSAITVGAVKEYQWKASPPLPSQGTYCYRPFLASTDLLGSAVSPQFTTQVAAGDTTPYSFDVFGDWGYDHAGFNADQANLYAQIAASGARFAVTVGDNGYPSGSQLNYGDLNQTGNDVSAIFGPSYWTVPGSSIPLFNTVGNHGVSSKAHTDIVTWTQNQAASSSGGSYGNDTYQCCGATGPVTYGDDWYAFDAGPARFYVLDSAWGDTNGGSTSPYAQDYANHWDPSKPEYKWLLADLQAHASVMKFAFSHYPFYSDSPSQGSDPFMTAVQPGASQSIENLLGQYGVKIVFNGHAHFYERNTPSAPGMPVSYVSGGGGAVLQPIGGPCSSKDAYGLGWSPTKLQGTACGSAPVPTSASQVFNFLKVTVNGTSVTVTPTDELGRTFDQKTYDFTPVVHTYIDSAPAASTNVASASVSFHSNAAGATFACALDGASPSACTSPATYPALPDGTHTFSVAATANGTTDSSPPTATWDLDTVAPSKPGSLTGVATAPTTVHLLWSSSSDANGVTQYDIVRDATALGSVPVGTLSYVDASAVAGTTYSYTVDAQDAAGNVSAASDPAVVTTPSGTTTPTLVQSATGSGTSTALTVPLPTTTTQSDLLVLSASVLTGATNHIVSVTDSSGGSWTRVGAYAVSGHNSDGELWYRANAPAVSWVTVHLATAVSTAVQVQEFAGVATSSALDASAGFPSTGTAADSGTLTPSAGNELLVGFAAGHANTQAMTPTVAGFTSLPMTLSGTSSSAATLVSGYEVLATPAATSYGATFPKAMYWAAGIAAFRAAG